MDYVNEEAAASAVRFETELLKLPQEAGVLFVSVQAVPVSDGASTELQVVLGLRRLLTESAGKMLVSVMAGILGESRKLRVQVVLGAAAPGWAAEKS